MQLWWCSRCDTTVRCLAASGVQCRKGHAMRRVTEEELRLHRVAEGYEEAST